MTHGVRRALRTAEYNGRESYLNGSVPGITDQQPPNSDSQPLPAQLRRPPTSDGSLDVAAAGALPIYNSPLPVGNINETNTISPQILNREA